VELGQSAAPVRAKLNVRDPRGDAHVHILISERVVVIKYIPCDANLDTIRWLSQRLRNMTSRIAACLYHSECSLACFVAVNRIATCLVAVNHLTSEKVSLFYHSECWC
jgi:hypothetical protein